MLLCFQLSLFEREWPTDLLEWLTDLLEWLTDLLEWLTWE